MAFADNVNTFKASKLKLFRAAAKEFRDDVDVFVLDGDEAGACQDALSLMRDQTSVIAFNAESDEFAEFSGFLTSGSLTRFISKQLTSGVSGAPKPAAGLSVIELLDEL